ncbi:MAG: hypothetical protein N2645_01160 [Clostridia bacterium]|nr:hypothetical protein [Clostridia bacterium]
MRDSRCLAAVNLDGGHFFLSPEERIPKPYLMMLSTDLYFHKDFELAMADSLHDAYMVKAKNTTHMNYMDHSLLFQDRKQELGLGAIDGKVMINNINRAVSAFLDMYVKKENDRISTNKLINQLEALPETEIDYRIRSGVN